jgi:hypothetical protein
VFEDHELVTWSLLIDGLIDQEQTLLVLSPFHAYLLSSRLPSLSQNLPISRSPCFQQVFNDALEEYLKWTKNDLTNTHPLPTTTEDHEFSHAKFELFNEHVSVDVYPMRRPRCMLFYMYLLLAL